MEITVLFILPYESITAVDHDVSVLVIDPCKDINDTVVDSVRINIEIESELAVLVKRYPVNIKIIDIESVYTLSAELFSLRNDVILPICLGDIYPTLHRPILIGCECEITVLIVNRTECLERTYIQVTPYSVTVCLKSSDLLFGTVLGVDNDDIVISHVLDIFSCKMMLVVSRSEESAVCCGSFYRLFNNNLVCGILNGICNLCLVSRLRNYDLCSLTCNKIYGRRCIVSELHVAAVCIVLCDKISICCVLKKVYVDTLVSTHLNVLCKVLVILITCSAEDIVLVV